MKMKLSGTCVGGILLHFGPLPTTLWTSAVNIRNPNVPPFHRTFVSRGILPEVKKLSTKIEKKEKSFASKRLVAQLFLLPSLVWATGQLFGHLAIEGLRPQNRIPLQSRRRGSQTSQHDKHQDVKGSPGQNYSVYMTTTAAAQKIGGGDFVIDKIIITLFDEIHPII